MALPEQLVQPDSGNTLLPEDSSSILRAREYRQTSEALIQEATQRQSEVILSAHKGPDDDAMYSLRAYLTILRKQFPGGRFRVVMSNRKVAKYDALFEPGDIVWTEEEVVTSKYGNRNADIVDYLAPDSLLIFMDAAQFSRISNLPEAVQVMANGQAGVPETKLTNAVSDHHTGQPDPHTAGLFEPNKTSTCELIYMMYRNTNLPPEVCRDLLRGLFSDTRFMRFITSSNPQVLQYVGELLHRSGLPNLNVIYREMYKKPKALSRSNGN